MPCKDGLLSLQVSSFVFEDLFMSGRSEDSLVLRIVKILNSI